MQPKRVLITDHPFRDLEPEREIFAPLGLEIVQADDTDETTLVTAMDGVCGVMVCYAPLTAPVIEAAAAAGCRTISRYGIGLDNVDVDAATRVGMWVTNVPDYCLDEVADHALGLLLASARAIVRSDRDVAAGEWQLPSREVHRLAGRRLALIGHGAIGRRVAARAQAFGIEVTSFDPYADRASIGTGISVAESAAEAVADADFISLHAPLTPSTRHLVDGSLFAAMRRRPFLINTARGGLIDLDASVSALAEGRVSGLALDVTEPEPLPDPHPLRGHPDVILTPHTAFHSEESQIELQRRAAGAIVEGLGGAAPRDARNADLRQPVPEGPR